MIPVRGSPTVKQRGGVSCTECGGSNLLRDYETGELVCQGCGFVISSTLIDQGPEWRAFDHEETDKRSRAGAPASWALYDKGLSTSIGWQDRDASGRRFGAGGAGPAVQAQEVAPAEQGLTLHGS